MAASTSTLLARRLHKTWEPREEQQQRRLRWQPAPALSWHGVYTKHGNRGKSSSSGGSDGNQHQHSLGTALTQNMGTEGRAAAAAAPMATSTSTLLARRLHKTWEPREEQQQRRLRWQ